MSEWCSRSDMHEATVIQNSIHSGNDQALRDHEFRMLQVKMQFQKKKLESEERKEERQLEQ